MTFRWYGKGNDCIKLSDIKQIPGAKGIVWALHDKMPARFVAKKKRSIRIDLEIQKAQAKRKFAWAFRYIYLSV